MLLEESMVLALNDEKFAQHWRRTSAGGGVSTAPALLVLRKPLSARSERSASAVASLPTKSVCRAVGRKGVSLFCGSSFDSH